MDVRWQRRHPSGKAATLRRTDDGISIMDELTSFAQNDGTPVSRGETETDSTVELKEGVRVKIVSGEVNGVKGPVRDIFVEPEYFYVELAPGAEFEHLTKRGYTIFAYVFEGSGYFDSGKGQRIGKENLIYEDGEFGENNNGRASYPVLAGLRQANL